MLGVEIHKTIITVLPEKYQSTLFPAKNIKITVLQSRAPAAGFLQQGSFVIRRFARYTDLQLTEYARQV